MTDTEIILEQLKNMQKSIDDMRNDIDGMRNDIENRLQSLDERLTGEIKASEQRMMGEIKASEQRTMGEIKASEQRMTAKQDEFRDEMLTEFQKQTDTLDRKSHEIDEHLAQVEHQLKVYLENAVGRRIDVLFEGYEIEHSHRVRLKQDTYKLEKQLEELSSRLRRLEEKHTA